MPVAHPIRPSTTMPDPNAAAAAGDATRPTAPILNSLALR